MTVLVTGESGTGKSTILKLILRLLQPDRGSVEVFGDHIAPDPGDPWFVLTVLKWGMHQMRLGMPDFWNLPFFFPARGVTTYSDNLLGPAAIMYLVEPGTNPSPGFHLFAGSTILGAFFIAEFHLSGEDKMEQPQLGKFVPR